MAKKLLLLAVGVLGAAAALVLAAPFQPHDSARATHAMPCSDLDGSGTVTLADYFIEQSYSGQTIPPAPAATDLDGDAQVGLVNDLYQARYDYGQVTGCQDTPVGPNVPPTPGPPQTAQMGFGSPISGTYGCNDNVTPRSCLAEYGSVISLKVAISEAPSQGYIGFQAQTAYGSWVYKPSGSLFGDAGDVTWPEAGMAARQPFAPTGLEGLVSYASLTAFENPSVSFYQGDVLAINVNCPGNEESYTFALPIATASNPIGALLMLPDGETVAPQALTTMLVPEIDPVNPVPIADALTIHCYNHASWTDDDQDMCQNVKEWMPNEALGGMRDPYDHWDFFDVWTRPFGDPSGWERTRVIDLFGDIFGVAMRFGAERPGGPPSESEALAEALLAPASGNATGYHAEYDRSAPAPGANYWQMGQPDGTIDLFNDIFGVAMQFGHDCTLLF